MQITVGTAAVQIPHLNLLDGGTLMINNQSAGKLYIGTDNTVTATGATGGLEVPPGLTPLVFPKPINNMMGDVWLISDTAAQDVRYLLV